MDPDEISIYPHELVILRWLCMLIEHSFRVNVAERLVHDVMHINHQLIRLISFIFSVPLLRIIPLVDLHNILQSVHMMHRRVSHQLHINMISTTSDIMMG